MKYADLTTKKAKVQFIRDKLSNDKQWAIRGLLRIYSCQTTSEQAANETEESNGVGFNGMDAELLSSFAQQYIQHKNLSDKQMIWVHKKMPKYASQLERLSS